MYVYFPPVNFHNASTSYMQGMLTASVPKKLNVPFLNSHYNPTGQCSDSFVKTFHSYKLATIIFVWQ